MPLRRLRRQYEQLSQFQRRRIIDMMGAGCSTRRVACQLGRSDCVVRRCWDQWIQEMSFIRRPGPGHLRQTIRREDCHIVRIAHVHPTVSLTTILAQVAPSLGTLCLLEPYEAAWLKDIWDRGAHFVLPLTPTHR
ncbi:uncharacterized protein TNCV_4214821 [Trichonephila clavipes]|nr:uncharacterized protein TNCV_4214821 [Trichonephila clavipes]